MEQINQPRGEPDDITSHQHSHVEHQANSDAPLAVPPYQADAPGQRPPVTFPEAEAHNPFALLTEMHDHAMALRLHEKPPTFHLTELALSAAVVAWWSRWQPLTMHRAFVAGASLGEVAAAVGTTEAEAYERWNAWAERQSQLVINGRAGVDAAEVAWMQLKWRGSERGSSSPIPSGDDRCSLYAGVRTLESKRQTRYLTSPARRPYPKQTEVCHLLAKFWLPVCLAFEQRP